MIVDVIINRTLASQILLFDGWIQVHNEKVQDVWWEKNDLHIVIKPTKPYGISLVAVDPTFEKAVSEMHFCQNISDFSRAISRIKAKSI